MAIESPLLTRPGAVPVDSGPDLGVAEHYGDPLGEQRAMNDRVAVVDQSHRGVLTVGGPDRLSWLHSLTSQHLSALPAGYATEALLLDPNGRVEHHLVVADDGETTWIDTEPGAAPAVVEFLDRMRFMLRVEVTEVTDAWGLLTVVGPDVAQVVEPPPPGEIRSRPDRGFARGRRWPPGAVDLLVPRDALAAVATELIEAGAAPAGIWAWEAVRTAAREPRLGLDTDARTIPHEVGWLDTAVHLDKGCYRGQETVARVHNLGRPPRRLVLLHLDGTSEALPAPAEEVSVNGRTVGRVGTTARHHELGDIALALVKRTVADDATLRIGDVAAAIDPAPETESAAAESPRRARPQLARFDRGT